MLVISHLYITLCTTSLIEMDSIVLVSSTSIREVIHKVVRRYGMTNIPHICTCLNIYAYIEIFI